MNSSIPQPPPRYCKRPLPAYRHRPGRTPHPVLDPKGHLYGLPEAAVEPFDARRWNDSEAYLFGVDLWNQGYFWEAHEAWEGIWKETPSDSPARLFLQGMIQLAAALLQREMGKLSGMHSLSEKGLKKLRRVSRRQSTFCGLDLKKWISEFPENLKAGQIYLLVSRQDAKNATSGE